ncbi:signal peptidase I [uncultured Tateyamaria sp.]|uniref:signal peptidase I n=1 Tax=Tateyamaria sp. 1078 TaxID=3417464 RepID=UPI00262036DA|nr:signal peptidase I [uncultured Tateyamaria sp.]
MSTAISATQALRQSFDWTGISGRTPYAIAFVLQLFFVVAGVSFPAAPAWIWIACAIATFVFLGQLRRRLRDAGWRGGWMWVAIVPYLGVIPQIILLFRRSADNPRRGEPAALRKIGWGLALLLCLLVAGRGMFYAPYWIPSTSMKPALMPGDYVFAGSRVLQVARGDVVVFRHPVTGMDFVKRVIALGGDTVQLLDGQVILNGTPVAQAPGPDFTERMARQGPHGVIPRCAGGIVAMDAPCLKRSSVETLPSGRSYTVLDVDATPVDNTEAFTVPEGHMFVLGDNRDNSADSRMAQVVGGVGFVPLENVKGRVSWIAFSLTGDMSRLFRRVP